MLQWAVLTNMLKTKGTPLPIMDSLIGATCLARKFALVTRNEKDFKHIGIKIINPFLQFYMKFETKSQIFRINDWNSLKKQSFFCGLEIVDGWTCQHHYPYS